MHPRCDIYKEQMISTCQCSFHSSLVYCLIVVLKKGVMQIIHIKLDVLLMIYRCK